MIIDPTDFVSLVVFGRGINQQPDLDVGVKGTLGTMSPLANGMESFTEA